MKENTIHKTRLTPMSVSEDITEVTSKQSLYKMPIFTFGRYKPRASRPRLIKHTCFIQNLKVGRMLSSL